MSIESDTSDDHEEPTSPRDLREPTDEELAALRRLARGDYALTPRARAALDRLGYDWEDSS